MRRRHDNSEPREATICAVEDDGPAALAEYDGPGAPVGSRALFFSGFFAPNATHVPSS